MVTRYWDKQIVVKQEFEFVLKDKENIDRNKLRNPKNILQKILRDGEGRIDYDLNI